MDSLRTSFSRADAARAIGVAPNVIDALVGSGAVRVNGDTIAAVDLESFFRDSLLRLYRAEAAPVVIEAKAEAEHEHEIELEAAPEPAPEPVTRNIAEYVANDQPQPETDVDLRVAVRYVPRRQIGGAFNQVRFALLQISNTGLRIRHDDTLLPGEESRLTLSLQTPARTFHMRARVVWTSIAQRGEGPTFCISGIRVTDDADKLRQVVAILRDARELVVDGKSAPKATERADMPRPLRSVSDDEVATILKALRHLTSDPIEANRWYARARFAAAEPQVRRAAPIRAADREQVLGIWEYLERKIEIGKIAGVVSWSHQARAAAV